MTIKNREITIVERRNSPLYPGFDILVDGVKWASCSPDKLDKLVAHIEDIVCLSDEIH